MNTIEKAPQTAISVSGLLDDNLEIWFENDKLNAIYKGKTMGFFDLPEPIVSVFREEYKADLKAQSLFDEIGVTRFRDQLYTYVKCKYGGFDLYPDFTPETKQTHSEYWNCHCSGNCCLKPLFRKHFEFNDQKLSSREVEIIRAICSGKVGKQIADELCISENTFSNHRANIYKKTGSANSIELMGWALKQNLL